MRPTKLPRWATDASYLSGPDSGLEPRLEPTSGGKAQGFMRGKRAPARWINWLIGLLCDWVNYLDEQTPERLVSGLRAGVSVTYVADWGGATGVPAVAWSPYDRCYIWAFNDKERFTYGALNGGPLSGWTRPANLTGRPRIAVNDEGIVVVAYDRSVAGTDMVKRVTDGLTSTTTVTVASTDSTYDVVWDGSKFVLAALGDTGTYSSGWVPPHTLVLSAATPVPVGITNFLLTDGSGRVIALTQRASIPGFSPVHGRSCVSTDSAATWNQVVVDSEAVKEWTAACYSSRLGKFVAFGNNQSNARRVWMTADGITWEAGQAIVIGGHTRFDLGSAVEVTSVVEHQSVLFAAVPDSVSTTAIIYSTDGINWFPAAELGFTVDHLVAGGPSLIAVGLSGAIVSI